MLNIRCPFAEKVGFSDFDQRKIPKIRMTLSLKVPKLIIIFSWYSLPVSVRDNFIYMLSPQWTVSVSTCIAYLSLYYRLQVHLWLPLYVDSWISIYDSAHSDSLLLFHPFVIGHLYWNILSSYFNFLISGTKHSIAPIPSPLHLSVLSQLACSIYHWTSRERSFYISPPN